MNDPMKEVARRLTTHGITCEYVFHEDPINSTYPGRVIGTTGDGDSFIAFFDQVLYVDIYVGEGMTEILTTAGSNYTYNTAADILAAFIHGALSAALTTDGVRQIEVDAAEVNYRLSL